MIRARGISKGALQLDGAVDLLSAYGANDVFIWVPRGRCTKTDDAMLARDGAVHESVGLAREASLQGLCDVCVDLR